jgi:hypothetical protein
VETNFNQYSLNITYLKNDPTLAERVEDDLLGYTLSLYIKNHTSYASKSEANELLGLFPMVKVWELLSKRSILNNS